MDMNKMTEKTQEALINSQSLAVRKGHQQVDVEHLFLSLLTQEDGITTSILQRLTINPEDVISDVEEALKKFEEADTLAAEIEKRLSALENEVTVLKERFDEV